MYLQIHLAIISQSHTALAIWQTALSLLLIQMWPFKANFYCHNTIGESRTEKRCLGYILPVLRGTTQIVIDKKNYLRLNSDHGLILLDKLNAHNSSYVQCKYWSERC